MIWNPISLAALLTLCSVLCQWTAWRFRLPALVLLSLCGIILGPVCGIISPEAFFGKNLAPLCSLAVAVILFEGGMNLHFAELHSTKKAALGMIVFGAPLGWALISSGLYFIAGFSIPVSVMTGGLLVVTGPTVIMPMLRQARLNPRVSSVLKWEGIVNDPIGALFATLTLEYFSSAVIRHAPAKAALFLCGAVLLISLMSCLTGLFLSAAFRKNWVPEFLKPLFTLAAAVCVYAAGNALQNEGGLVAVTVLGMTLANVPFPSFEEQRRFKEYLTTLLISFVFIILTATLKPESLLNLPADVILFVCCLLFLIRPLTVWLATVKSGLSTQERAFVGWIAPRGVVCVVVAGLFAPKMTALGYEDAKILVPMIFCIVFSTVILHGFTIRPFAKRLGLIPKGKEGVFIVGASPLTAALAEILIKQDVPVLVADGNWQKLTALRQARIPTAYGEPLADSFEHQVDLTPYSILLAMSDNAAYNTLVCSHFSYEFGGNKSLQTPEDHEEKKFHAYQTAAKQSILISESESFEKLQKKLFSGWAFGATKITEKFTYNDFLQKNGQNTVAVAVLSDGENVRFATAEKPLIPKNGETLVYFAAPHGFLSRLIHQQPG